MPTLPSFHPSPSTPALTPLVLGDPPPGTPPPPAPSLSAAQAPSGFRAPAPGSSPSALQCSPGKALLAPTLGLLPPALMARPPGRGRPLTCSRTLLPSLPPLLRSGLALSRQLTRVWCPFAPSPLPLVLQICLRSPSPVFLLPFSLICAPPSLSPSSLHLVKITHDCHVAKARGQLFLKALSTASGEVRGSHVPLLVPAAAGRGQPVAFSLTCCILARAHSLGEGNGAEKPLKIWR